MKNLTKAFCTALLFAAPMPALAQGIAVHDSANLIQQINAVRQAIQVVAQGKQQIAEAQKLYVLNGSRTAPRYSVGSDPEVRRMSSIFEAVDAMSWRDELQFWPRPPVPEIAEIIQICGEELHDMLRGLTTPKAALEKAQKRADQIMQKRTSS